MPLESLNDEADRILKGAEEKGITLRLLGGMAVSVRCPSASKPPLSRRYVDIDVMGRRKEVAKINQLFKELGYKARERFGWRLVRPSSGGVGFIRNYLGKTLDQIASLRRDLIVAIEHDRRGKDAQVLGALSQQPIEQHLIEPFGAL